jgi:hypothetical protein
LKIFVNISKNKLTRTQLLVLYLRSLIGNYCGGLTGNKYEDTKYYNPTIT